jgi:hypothetical protein
MAGCVPRPRMSVAAAKEKPLSTDESRQTFVG